MGRRLGTAFVTAALAPAALGAGQLTFRTGVDLATFTVTVTGRAGAPVADLTEDEFVVVEDGRPQALRFFARGDGGTAPPLHVGLMLDMSGSMERDLDLARAAAIRFLNLLPEAVDITLVDFDTQVRISQYPQRDFPRLVERIRMRKPAGMTALYDALGTYLDGADEQEGRTILVMFTDGDDTRSALSWRNTLTLLKASQVTVYAIGLIDHTGPARFNLQLRLRALAGAAGGAAFFPGRMANVEEAFARVLAEIKAQYHLGYVSTNAATDGAWRKVDITVTRPDLEVRTRGGYFAPYRSPG